MPLADRLASIDAAIAVCHEHELRAYWACKDEEAQWCVFRVQRLQDLRWRVEVKAARTVTLP